MLLKPECLTLWASLPFHRWRLVSTNVNHFRGEDVHDFCEHILHELIDLRITHAEHIGIDSPVVSYLIRTTRATQFWIAGQCCQHVTRHVDFWNHGDVALLGILHNLSGFFLRVESTMGDAVVKVGVRTENGACTL